MLLANYTLQLLHASDFEGGIPAIDDAPRFSAIVNGLKAQYPGQTLVVSSGDNYLPGPFYSASADPSMAGADPDTGHGLLGLADSGRGDIAILNAIGIQVSTLGNHDFDEGCSRISSLINPVTRSYGSWEGAEFPYVSANLDLHSDPSLGSAVVTDHGREASTIEHKIASDCVVTVDGEKIGIVGTTTPRLPTINTFPSTDRVVVSPGLDQAEDMQQLALAIQPDIDALIAQGVNKIVVLSHLQQLTKEEELAGYLRGVDVIVAGGSHQVAANEGDYLRSGDVLNPDYPYPIVRTGADGGSVLVVNTAANYRYVGRLVVTFDEQGELVEHDAALSHAYATDQTNLDALRASQPNPTDFVANTRVTDITGALARVLDTKDGRFFGQTSVYLNGRDIRTRETNLSDLMADADLATAQNADSTVVAAFKAAGVIRDNIGSVDPSGQKVAPAPNPRTGKQAGQISQLDIENTLRYNNPLTLVTLTADQLVQVLEHAVAASAAGQYPGQFAQVSGVAFSYDLSRPAYDPNAPAISRIRSASVLNADGTVRDVLVRDGQLLGDAQRLFRVCVLSYMADGGDHYPLARFQTETPAEQYHRVDLATAPTGGAAAAFDTPGCEQKSLADYLAAHYTDTAYAVADVGAKYDQRLQNLSVRGDTVLRGVPGVGLYRADYSYFLEKHVNASGFADVEVPYGTPEAGLPPLVGDWTGQGFATPGLFDPQSSTFLLRNANTAGEADLVAAFGPAHVGWLPLVGDWDGDGRDTLGLYDPVNSQFYLRNSNDSGFADLQFGYGVPDAGWLPMAGDWDGDSVDTVGLYDPATATVLLRNANSTGTADVQFAYGAAGAGWTPLAGDWNRDGIVSVGLYDAAASIFYLRNANTSGMADLTFAYGAPGAGWVPVAGDWLGVARAPESQITDAVESAGAAATTQFAATIAFGAALMNDNPTDGAASANPIANDRSTDRSGNHSSLTAAAIAPDEIDDLPAPGTRPALADQWQSGDEELPSPATSPATDAIDVALATTARWAV
jgi:2',3'-cyclic-nucleotide 2'-phosphodiesterase (5'-nucleotidase family)